MGFLVANAIAGSILGFQWHTFTQTMKGASMAATEEQKTTDSTEEGEAAPVEGETPVALFGL